MAKAPKCKTCKVEHWPRFGCSDAAINKAWSAINRPKERLTDAINKVVPAINVDSVARGGSVGLPSVLAGERRKGAGEEVVGIGGAVDMSEVRSADADDKAEVGGSSSRTPNRRNRDDYNAYMRDYMRQIRLVEREKKRGL